MNVGAMSITSNAIQGLNKAEAAATGAARNIASGTAQTSAGSQIIAGADTSLADALVALTMAKISFEANAEMIKIGDAMVKTLIGSIK